MVVLQQFRLVSTLARVLFILMISGEWRLPAGDLPWMLVAEATHDANGDPSTTKPASGDECPEETRKKLLLSELKMIQDGESLAKSTFVLVVHAEGDAEDGSDDREFGYSGRYDDEGHPTEIDSHRPNGDVVLPCDAGDRVPTWAIFHHFEKATCERCAPNQCTGEEKCVYGQHIASVPVPIGPIDPNSHFFSPAGNTEFDISQYLSDPSVAKIRPKSNDALPVGLISRAPGGGSGGSSGGSRGGGGSSSGGGNRGSSSSSSTTFFTDDDDDSLPSAGNLSGDAIGGIVVGSIVGLVVLYFLSKKCLRYCCAISLPRRRHYHQSRPRAQRPSRGGRNSDSIDGVELPRRAHVRPPLREPYV